jgi:hypothetical protein
MDKSIQLLKKKIFLTKLKNNNFSFKNKNIIIFDKNPYFNSSN